MILRWICSQVYSVELVVFKPLLLLSNLTLLTGGVHIFIWVNSSLEPGSKFFSDARPCLGADGASLLFFYRAAAFTLLLPPLFTNWCQN